MGLGIWGVNANGYGLFLELSFLNVKIIHFVNTGPRKTSFLNPGYLSNKYVTLQMQLKAPISVQRICKIK